MNEDSTRVAILTPSVMPNAKRIAVIGAGACGLCAAKYLTQSEFDVTIFEIGSQIGGLWCFMNDNGRSSAYRTLHINTSRGVTRFHDLDFDADVQAFPDHNDMHTYLVKYARQFDLERLIRFQSRVTDIRPMFDPKKGEPPRWNVELEIGESEIFDSVIIATGHLSVPLHVPMFRDDFTGEYVHGHDYKDPVPFVGKQICIVGVGNSACDIAGDVCVTSPKCVLGTPGDNENPLLNRIPLTALTALPLPPGGRPPTGTALKNCLVRTLLHIVPLCPTKPHKRLAHASHLASTNVRPEQNIPCPEHNASPHRFNITESANSTHVGGNVARDTRKCPPCRGRRAFATSGHPSRGRG